MKTGELTPTSDKNGINIFVCEPEWFDTKENYKIKNAPARTSSLEFSGSDLNYLARVLYAEASGKAELLDKLEREKEKEAILNVNHFRLNRPYYPNRNYIAKTFREVCDAPGQFESVFKNRPKFLLSEKPLCLRLNKAECSDLDESLLAIKTFLDTGPNLVYLYDNFRGFNPSGTGTHIGRSRFWLSKSGKEFSDKIP